MTSMHDDPFQHPLAKARGLGSAKDGTHHWIVQRATALMLIPLSLWFVYSLITLAFYRDTAVLVKWFDSPFHALGMALLLGSMFYHAALGMQVVIEDYIHCKCMKLALVAVTYFLFLAACVLSIMAVMVMHFGESVMVD